MRVSVTYRDGASGGNDKERKGTYHGNLGRAEEAGKALDRPRGRQERVHGGAHLHGPVGTEDAGNGEARLVGEVEEDAHGMGARGMETVGGGRGRRARIRHGETGGELV